jgi:hypothetical protein
MSFALEMYFQKLDLEGICRRLSYVRQHGDLVANNVGVTARGIVIFDWEDFGRVELPGFDIALFLASCLDYNPVMLKRWFEQGVLAN